MNKLIILLLLLIKFEPVLIANDRLKGEEGVELNKHFIYPPSDTTLTILMNMDINSFHNKPVDSTIVALPAGYLSRKIVGGGRPRYADVLLVFYPNNVTVHIYVKQFSHMNPYNKNLQWDFELFRKEKIDHIEIHAGPQCVKGCL